MATQQPPPYRKWVENVRARHRENFDRRTTELQNEIDKLKKDLQESQEAPDEVREEIQSLEEEIAQLMKQIDQHDAEIADVERTRRQRLEDETRDIVQHCEAIIAQHETAEVAEKLHLANEFFDTDIVHKAKREVERIIRDQSAQMRKNEAVARLAKLVQETHEAISPMIAAMQMAHEWEAELDSLNAKISDIESQLYDEHSVSRDVIAAVRKLRDDQQFIAFCEQKASDARQEREWDLHLDENRDVLTPFSSGGLGKQ